MSRDTAYEGETFSRFVPEDGELHGYEFVDCLFQDCRWQGVRVSACTFIDCTFERCQFSEVQFSASVMRDSWLKHCEFRFLNWGTLQPRHALTQPFSRAEQCSFFYCDFPGLSLPKFDFSTCQFRECTFEECALMSADFREVAFAGTQFVRCDLSKADLRDSRGFRIPTADNILKGAKFTFPEVLALLDDTGIEIDGF